MDTNKIKEAISHIKKASSIVHELMKDEESGVGKDTQFLVELQQVKQYLRKAIGKMETKASKG